MIVPKNAKAFDSLGRTLKSKNHASPQDKMNEQSSNTTEAVVLLEWAH